MEALRTQSLSLTSQIYGSSGSGADLKSQLPTHIQHRCIFVQNLRLDDVKTLGSTVSDQGGQQLPSEPVALRIRANEDGVLAGIRLFVACRRATPSISPEASSRATKATALS